MAFNIPEFRMCFDKPIAKHDEQNHSNNLNPEFEYVHKIIENHGGELVKFNYSDTCILFIGLTLETINELELGKYDGIPIMTFEEFSEKYKK